MDVPVDKMAIVMKNLLSKEVNKDTKLAQNVPCVDKNCRNE